MSTVLCTEVIHLSSDLSTRKQLFVDDSTRNLSILPKDLTKIIQCVIYAVDKTVGIVENKKYKLESKNEKLQ